MKIIDRVRRRAGERGGTPAAMTFDPHPPRVVRPDKAPPLLMTTEQRIEALGRAGMQGVAVVRFTHEMSAVGPGDVRPHRARRVAARRRGVGRRELPLRPRSRRHVLRAAHARRALRLPRREDRSRPLQGLRRQQHAHPAAGRRGARRRGGRAARPSLLHRRHASSAAPARGREIGFPTANLETANELLPPAGRLCHHGDDRRHRAPVGDEHRDAPHVRRRRAACGSRRTSSTCRAISTTPGSACRSCSGCGTNARFPTSTRCARRSTPTAGRPGGCSAAFRCRIDGCHRVAAAAWFCG